jgi:uncharacterized protein
MKKAIYLNYINVLKDRLDRRAGLIQVILGPRQVGKTTTFLKLIEEHYSDQVHYVSADEVFNAEAEWLRQQWIYALQEKKILAVDEIQKCFNWAAAIKSLYDETKRAKKKLQCVLLGSSSLEIQRGLTESLTGRFQLIQAHHWNYEESRRGYGLAFEEYLHFGGYPGSYEFLGTAAWHHYVKNSIVNSVVEKDILQFNKIRSPALFRQAFDLLISYPAQEISFTKLLGQLQERGNVELIKHYIKLYEGAFLLRALEKFSNKPTLMRTSSPKIIPLAPCLPYLQSRVTYERDEAGRVFEAIVGAQLIRTGEEVYYWREGKFEVDFVVKIGRAIYGVEVKSGRVKGTRGLEAFRSRFPKAKLCLVTPELYQEFEADPIKFLGKGM